jgi:hypothetical protein
MTPECGSGKRRTAGAGHLHALVLTTGNAARIATLHSRGAFRVADATASRAAVLPAAATARCARSRRAASAVSAVAADSARTGTAGRLTRSAGAVHAAISTSSRARLATAARHARQRRDADPEDKSVIHCSIVLLGRGRGKYGDHVSPALHSMHRVQSSPHATIFNAIMQRSAGPFTCVGLALAAAMIAREASGADSNPDSVPPEYHPAPDFFTPAAEVSDRLSNASTTRCGAIIIHSTNDAPNPTGKSRGSRRLAWAHWLRRCRNPSVLRRQRIQRRTGVGRPEVPDTEQQETGPDRVSFRTRREQSRSAAAIPEYRELAAITPSSTT